MYLAQTIAVACAPTAGASAHCFRTSARSSSGINTRNHSRRRRRRDFANDARPAAVHLVFQVSIIVGIPDQSGRDDKVHLGPGGRRRAPPGDAAPPSRPPASRPAKETVKPAIKSLQASADKITELFGDEGWQFNLDNFTSSILQAPLTNGEGQGLTSPEESDSISARRVITGQNPGGMAPTPPPTISALSTSNGQGLTSPGDSDLDQIPGVIAPTPAPMINAISTSSASDESQQTAVEISDHNEFDLENLQVNC